MNHSLPPVGWENKFLGEIVGRITTGKLDANAMNPDGDFPFFTCAREQYWIDKFAFDTEALLVSGNGANVGYVHYYNGKFNAYQRTYVLANFSEDVQFIRHYLDRNLYERIRVEVNAGNTPYITMGTLSDMSLAIPSDKAEQKAIAIALSDIDALLDSIDRLIAKKRNLKQAAMQQLLTGQTRLPGFSGEWEVKRIAEIGTPSSEKNVEGATLPVLTCSKHFGFMDSLGFFKNQVFSKDLSMYKVIRRDEIGYPSNHIEEGSIGIQDLYEIALVSPIYIVFGVAEFVSSYFLHRLLKLDSYRKQFKTASTSSVDRRGSLRWKAFSEITVKLPPTKTEQITIAETLSDMEVELNSLEERRKKTVFLKQGMMQELLTGRTRLI
jgi:restriction endonuclease S subunit